MKLRQLDEGGSALEEHLAQLRGDVVVTKASIGHFELGPLDRQRVIEPAYAFVYVVRYNEVAMKSAFVVHAGERRSGS